MSDHAPVITESGEIRPRTRAPLRERVSWAIYDFANTIFSMNVATLYFGVWLISDLGVSNTAFALGNVVSSLMVALSIPILGALSDVRRRRKPWVVTFTLIACGMTVVIGVLGQTVLPLRGEGVIGGLPEDLPYHVSTLGLTLVIVAFIVANYTYQGALPFYNAMLPELVPPAEQGRLSGFGTAIGYAGSIFGLLMAAPFFMGRFPVGGELPAGLMQFLRDVIPFTEHAGRVSIFVPTALLFLLFSIPFFLFTHDHNPVREKRPIRWREPFVEVFRTFKESRKYPGALRFIVASFMYQDAIGTIITFMGVYTVVAMGFGEGTEQRLFLVLTIPAIIGSYFIGLISDRFGPKRTMVITLISWCVLLVGMILAPTQMVFWMVGFGIGLIFGGVPTVERPLLLTLIPDVNAGRFFGLMVLSARAGAITGPLTWALAVDLLTPVIGSGAAYRAAVGTVLISMLIALILLWKVPDKRATVAR